MDAELEEVRERIDVRGGNVRIGREIGGRVEADRRIAALVPAELLIVVERIDVRVRHVGIGREIAVGVEQRVRIAASFQPTVWKCCNGSTCAAATSGLCCR